MCSSRQIWASLLIPSKLHSGKRFEPSKLHSGKRWDPTGEEKENEPRKRNRGKGQGGIIERVWL